MQVARELEEKGEPFAIATVVNRRPPVSAQLGDKAIVKADGMLIGWIGGSCSQPVVRREAQAAMAENKPRLVKLTTESLDAIMPDPNVSRVAMTCPSGGQAEIYIEPHLQRPSILAVGETPVVRAIAQLAPVVGFDVTVVTESGTTSAGGPADGVRLVTLVDLAAPQVKRNTFVIVASAGHYDEEGLARALRTEAPYVALVASRKRSAAVMEYLRSTGVSESVLARVRTPAGLDLGAATQEEIALGILAEVVKEYRSRVRAELSTMESLPMAAPVLATDPVCGMAVEVAGARHSFEHDGQVYYFCCPHCRAHFAKNPAAYLQAGDARNG